MSRAALLPSQRSNTRRTNGVTRCAGRPGTVTDSPSTRKNGTRRGANHSRSPTSPSNTLANTSTDQLEKYTAEPATNPRPDSTTTPRTDRSNRPQPTGPKKPIVSFFTQNRCQ
ncbi:hypothetical protein GCM10010442_82290 [Kitasatospora kifunensis]